MPTHPQQTTPETLPAETLPADRVAELTARVRALLPGVRADLEALVRIPGVSAASFPREPVERSAAAVAELMRGAGLHDVEVLRVEIPGTGGQVGAPAVVGHRPGPPGAPTVLLYAHHDVQPPGREELWASPPFEPVEREGRLHARGAADDKAGICVHLAALRALGDDLPVSVTVFVEGEEEVGSPSFDAFLATHRDRLAADVIVVADSGNWRIGEPALTTSLRGLVELDIEVRTLDHAVHSGMYGGAAPDAVLALIRTLNSLWDERGVVAVPGLLSGESEDPGYPEDLLRLDAGVLDGVRLIGEGSLTSRLWTRPAATVVGMDVTRVADASNTLHPTARARISLRVAPGQDGDEALAAVAEHLRGAAPFGARVEVLRSETGPSWRAEATGPVYDVARWALRQAWGRAPVTMGVGGSIPFIASLQTVYPEAVVLVTGVEDPDTRAHGYDESLHLGEFDAACLAETLLLAALG